MKDCIILSVDAGLYIRHVNVRMIMKANAMNMYLLDTLSNVGCIMLETVYIMPSCVKANGYFIFLPTVQRNTCAENTWEKWIHGSEKRLVFLTRMFTMTMAHHYSHL